MRNYVQPGRTLTLSAPAGGIASGGLFKIGAIVAVAASTAGAGAEIDGSVEGVFDLAKAPADDIALGAPLYFDDTAKVLTLTGTGNTPAGYAVQAAGAGASAVRAKLVPSVG